MSSVRIIPPSNEYYNELVDELINEMNSGIIPWMQPWFQKVPTNLKTKRVYSIINCLNLNYSAKKRGFTSHYWISAKQAQSMRGRIKKDEIQRHSYVIMAKWKSKTYKNVDGEAIVKCWLMIRTYPIYNFEQTIGLKRAIQNEPSLFDDKSLAEEIIIKYKSPPKIEYVHGHAFYRPSDDLIGMPSKEYFIIEEEFYCTLFHELIHSTGHFSRLKRNSFLEKIKFGDEKYAKEEIVAEIGAASLCAISGFLYKTKKNSAAYLNNWLNGLKNDKTLLFRAANSSQQAVNFILGKKELDKTSEPTLFDDIYSDSEWKRNSKIEWK